MHCQAHLRQGDDRMVADMHLPTGIRDLLLVVAEADELATKAKRGTARPLHPSWRLLQRNALTCQQGWRPQSEVQGTRFGEPELGHVRYAHESKPRLCLT